MDQHILVINPGSTSTKVAVYQGGSVRFSQTLSHSAQELAALPNVDAKYIFRKQVMLQALQQAGIGMQDIDLVMSRGGLLRPIPSGVYAVSPAMVQELKHSPMQHASNLGAMIAWDLSQEYGLPAYIADPVVVDELQPLARYSGHPAFPRRSVFHALNQKEVAREYAESVGRPYEELRLIVAHMGGGVSVGAHEGGRVVDVNQALDGEGAFSPERSGSLPSGDLVRAAFSGQYTQAQLLEMIVGKGGMVAYCGTNDARVVEHQALEGDERCAEVYAAMAYQVAKDIGAMSTVLCGQVDAILLTGGMAYSRLLTDQIRDRTGHIGPVFIYPGEDEMQALARNGMKVLEGKVQPREY